MEVGDRVETCGRCKEYYDLNIGLRGVIVDKPQKYLGYIVKLDTVWNADQKDGTFYITSSCLREEGNTVTNTFQDPLEIKNVYFNDPVTVVMWKDGTKSIVRCCENDFYDPEKGLAMAIVKKALGNDNHFHKLFKKWIPKEDPIYFDEKCEKCKHNELFSSIPKCLACGLASGVSGEDHLYFEPVDSKK